MNSNITTKATANRKNGTAYMWLGFAMGLACMAALFIAGLVQGSSLMVVLASNTAAVLGGTWTAATVGVRKKAAAK